MSYLNTFKRDTKQRDEYVVHRNALQALRIDVVLREVLAEQSVLLTDPLALQNAALQKAFDQGFNHCLELVMGGILDIIPIEGEPLRDYGASAELAVMGYTQQEIDGADDEE